MKKMLLIGASLFVLGGCGFLEGVEKGAEEALKEETEVSREVDNETKEFESTEIEGNDPFTIASNKAFKEVQEVNAYKDIEENTFTRVNVKTKIQDQFTHERIIEAFNEDVLVFVQEVQGESFESVFINGMFETNDGNELPLIKVELLKSDLQNISESSDIPIYATNYIIDKKF